MRLEGFGRRARCEHCQRGLWVRHDTTGQGQVVDVVEFCGCSVSRFQAGFCADCNARVEGTVGKAKRCARHKLEVRRALDRRRHHANRARESERFREYSRRPEVRARRRASAKAWRKRNAEKVRRQKKRSALRHPDTLLATYERHSNANRPDRAQLKRDWAREHQQVYYAQKPVCRGCGTEVPWNGRGRPHIRCERCDPASWDRDQSAKREARRRERQGAHVELDRGEVAA